MHAKIILISASKLAAMNFIAIYNDQFAKHNFVTMMHRSMGIVLRDTSK